ncbi:MAG: peptidoglycan D,D-transpeptidase FtsI family protein [Candidatus Paceibacteria bacterium]
MTRTYKRSSPKAFVLRIHITTIVISLVGILIISRLSVLQVKEHKKWLAKAESQQQDLVVREIDRGDIFFLSKDGKLQLAAHDKHFPYVWAVPKEIKDPESASAILAQLLGNNKDELISKLSKKDDPYELLFKRIPEELASQIKNLNIKGIYIGEKKARFYPGKELASHVIGFVSEDSAGRIAGRYGLEASYDAILQGFSQNVSSDVPTFVSFRQKDNNLVAGSNLILSIDPNIEFEAERLLSASVEKWHAKSGTIIVMESHTGKILALANFPTFNPNEFNKEKNFEVFLNRAVSLIYEPGSVFKPFTIAAGLESGVITASSTYYDSGEFKVGNTIIRNAGDAAPKKEVTITRLLERSYNVGAAYVSSLVGPDFMREFLLRRFGFEERTGIDLPSEVKSDFRNLMPPEAKPVNFATASFGQGVAVTPIKLIQAFNAFANGGYLIRPYVVEQIEYPDGKITITEPHRIRQVVSRNTLDALVPMLESVVAGEHGSGKLARIKGYRIAGKTGTGEIPRKDAKGYSDKVNHTFIGFGPVTNPKVTILVRLEEPIGARYAEATAVPVFRDLMKYILNYYAIPPDNPEELKETR